MTFDVSALNALYATISAESGVEVSELRLLVGHMAQQAMSKPDLAAFRMAQGPWKELHDEVIPVMHFLSAGHTDTTRVRFSLDSSPYDAWVAPTAGEPFYIEVTEALARSSKESAKNMQAKGAVSGFLGLQDHLPQSEFESAKERNRIFHSRAGVYRALDAGISTAMTKKNKSKYAGFTLLIACDMAMCRTRSDEEWRTALSAQAVELPFAQVYLISSGTGSRIVRLK
ncbi:hypothetical protein [Ensifer sp. ENS12]|uniref:hypothetical protein n=1 Tax=Ensifer sp. ENS12 TaxID=2854774 RepID=UPI001C479F81|nr:hypothetical protein [Ensifer sp. ENS12]MBV7518969.1 hypothetical protein [Ensifer sp. ENS12]